MPFGDTAGCHPALRLCAFANLAELNASDLQAVNGETFHAQWSAHFQQGYKVDSARQKIMVGFVFKRV